MRRIHGCLALGMMACVARTEPAPLAHTDEMGLDNTWCAVVYEGVADDAAVAGFEVTPGEAIASVSGVHVGDAMGSTLLQELTVTEVQLARATQVLDTEPGPTGAVEFDGPCVDHFSLAAAVELDGGPLLLADFETTVLYFQGHDAGDGGGWDTAMMWASLADWEGSAGPSWDPAEVETVAMNVYGYWQGGTSEDSDEREPGEVTAASLWRVDVSFMGEAAPGQAALDETEEQLFEAELGRASAE